MKRFLLFAAVFAVSAPGVAMAQGISLAPDAIIAARQGGMALSGGASEAMKAAVQSGADVKPFAAGAAALAKWGSAFPALFAVGTQSGHDTKAKPEVWSDRAGFEKAAATLVSAAEKLAEVAKADDKAGFATAYAALGQACGGCHRTYRNR
jgi:cytochrome c556